MPEDNKKLNILLWRNWKPLYSYPAIFTTINVNSIGGTCSQLLWHARSLVNLGHAVQVLGASRESIVEEGVEFVGSNDKANQVSLITGNKINPPDIIFMEGAFHAASLFKSSFPKAKIIHVGQNIDRYGHKKAFAQEKYIDIYAFVSPGHLAEYSVRFPELRHKFLLIRNIVPWYSLYSKIISKPVGKKILWVGSWGKQGLRQWAETMQQILADYPSYHWVLCGPSYGENDKGMPPDIFSGLSIPNDRVKVKNLPLACLVEEISSSRIVLVSLGNETACISALDAHAMGRPVLSGNDMVFKYINPEGTGIRVFTPEERHNALIKLINETELCDRIGETGRELVLKYFTEKNQESDIQFVLNYLALKKEFNLDNSSTPPSKLKELVSNYRDKFRRKFHGIMFGLFK